MENPSEVPKKGNLIAAMFLVGGTCIGGGMLALPVATGVSGFLPSIVAMFACWLGMTLSALLLLEANLWMKEGAHIITITSTILGPVGRAVSWVLFLFVSYASLVAYTAAGGSLIQAGTENLVGSLLSKELACLLFIAFFGGVVYLGSRIVGRVNTILFVAMILAYLALIGTGLSEVKIELLSHRRWPTALLAIPLLLTSFSFQTMLPSLTQYLKRNTYSLRWAIIGGTTIAFAIYAIWQCLILGVVPVHGPNSLLTALEAGEPVTLFFREHVKSAWVATIAEYFAFFAIVTSFLGIALGLFDFLADGLKVKRSRNGNLLLGFLVIVPVYFFAIYFERIFLIALDTTGGFGDSILNGIIPVLLVWIGRYHLKFSRDTDYRVAGGKPLLIAVLIFFLIALGLETLASTGGICSILDYCKINGL